MDLQELPSGCHEERLRQAMTERTLLAGPDRRSERPDLEWVRGTCPCCGEDVISNAYYVAGGNKAGGYIIVWECWGSLSEPPTCDYRRIL
jgi:hypothetical protein